VTSDAALPSPLSVRVRATFLAPRRLPQELGDGSRWLDVLLISTAIAVLAVLGMPDDMFLDPMRDAVTRRGEPVVITSPPEVIIRWGRAMAMIATIATHPVIAFVLAGVLTLVFTILGGGQGSYRSYLSLSSHALLIPAFGTLLALALRLLTGWAGVDTSIRGFLETGADDFLPAAAIRLDPFVIWMIAVMGLAMHRIDQRRSTWRATLILLVGYLLIVLASTALLRT